MIALLAAAALAASNPSAPEIVVGSAEWGTLPPARQTPRNFPTVQMVTQVEHMLRHRDCRLSGQSADRFDITVPYAVLVAPDGRVQRILVSDLGCEPLESYVGWIVQRLAAQGDFRPTGEREARWFGSRINFNLR